MRRGYSDMSSAGSHSDSSSRFSRSGRERGGFSPRRFSADSASDNEIAFTSASEVSVMAQENRELKLRLQRMENTGGTDGKREENAATDDRGYSGERNLSEFRRNMKPWGDHMTRQLKMWYPRSRILWTDQGRKLVQLRMGVTINSPKRSETVRRKSSHKKNQSHKPSNQTTSKPNK